MPDYKFKVDKIVNKLIEIQIQEAKNLKILDNIRDSSFNSFSAIDSDAYEDYHNQDWNATTKTNLFATCYLWSMSGFVVYLIIYYSKYFQGNFFFNYAL